jgi:hypothetical protein
MVVGDPPCLLHDTPLSAKIVTNFADKLLSLGIFRSWTQATEFVFVYLCVSASMEMQLQILACVWKCATLSGPIIITAQYFLRARAEDIPIKYKGLMEICHITIYR